MKQKKGRPHTIDTQAVSSPIGTLGDIFQRFGIAASEDNSEDKSEDKNDSEAQGALETQDVSSSKLPLNIVMSRLRVRCERKHRGGKTVTVIEGVSSEREQLEVVLMQLKAALGCGGSVENDALVLQGDLRQRAVKWFEKTGGTLASR
jgi:translation initiation factor 1